MFQQAYCNPTPSAPWCWLPTTGRGRTALLAATGLGVALLAWLELREDEADVPKATEKRPQESKSKPEAVKSEESTVETPKANTEQEELFGFLVELRRRLFHMLRDISVLAREIRMKLAAQGVEVEEQPFRAQLAMEFDIDQKFKAIQAEVMKKCGCSEATLTTLTEASAAEVQRHAEAVRQMLADALGGFAPTLPGAAIPRELTAERVLDFHNKIQTLKIEKARKLAAQTAGRKFSAQELGSAVALLSQAAEQEVIEANSKLLGEGGELYFSAFAVQMRSPGFSERVSKLDKDHRRAMVAAFRDEASQVD
eukprot:gb/GFBE01039812.1/.p1 GENE.gb/GFBE01039812.1/~~gb/GFBE01039812.1/.p1  ORF type:complete len:311 (+),score=83.69 gb/GFBE01039812.1/:1-933(+)